jgi:hypothetical protein
MTSAIPNAVEPRGFTPDPSKRWPQGTINVVMMSRLVYRKGIDLVVSIIPRICKRYPQVHFIIGGDGPKRLILEEMRERHQLHERVELLGAVPHGNVRDVLCRGHIFLNCSLTESFCIAILEAACCGLYVVSTRVGGVPEVLPSHMVSFADPVPELLEEAMHDAMAQVGKVDPWALHEEVRRRYSWHDVARRTVAVYDKVAVMEAVPLLERLRRLFSSGWMQGFIGLMIATYVFIIWRVVEWWRPAMDIEVAPDMPLPSLPQRGSADAMGTAFALEPTTLAPAPATAAAPASATAESYPLRGIQRPRYAPPSATNHGHSFVPPRLSLRQGNFGTDVDPWIPEDDHGMQSSESPLTVDSDGDVIMRPPTLVTSQYAPLARSKSSGVLPHFDEGPSSPVPGLRPTMSFSSLHLTENPGIFLAGEADAREGINRAYDRQQPRPRIRTTSGGAAHIAGLVDSDIVPR